MAPGLPPRWELPRGLLFALVAGLLRSTLLTGLMLSAGLTTGSLLRLGLALAVVPRLGRLLTLMLILPAGLIPSTLDLVLRNRGSASRPTLLNAGLLPTAMLRSPPLVALLDQAMIVRPAPGRLLPTIRLAGLGGWALLSSLLVSASALLVRRLSAGRLVASSAVLSALALGAAVLPVHVVAQFKVRRGAIKRRPPFTRMEPESPR